MEIIYLILCYKGGKAAFSIAIAITKAVIEQDHNESLKIYPDKWVFKNVLQHQKK